MSIDPKIGRMGEVITLRGVNFGETRDEAYVTIAGIAPTNSSYHVWQNELIIIRIPELGESGLVYVHVDGKKSNGVLFSNSATLPKPAEGEELGLQPRITSISRQSGAPGTQITIVGNNFGISRENQIHSLSLQTMSGVFFSWDYESNTINPYVVREPEFIEVSEIEAGYESWSAREINIRVPDGAVSGNIEVRTPHGRSRPVFFDIGGKPGNKSFIDKRSYTINYSVDIRVHEAARPNTLYLWIPNPIISPSQRKVTLISRSTEPFIENHRGVSLYKFDNLAAGVNNSIVLSYNVEIYAIETAIRPASVTSSQRPALSAMHTQSTELIPSGDQSVRSYVSTITGREQNPYLKAKLIYDWIIQNIAIDKTIMYNINIISALQEKHADPYAAALLYTAMVRAAGIPCIPIAGALIDKSGKTFHHYWAEFWIDNFGWVPVDPAMGQGTVTIENAAMHGEVINYSNYYFGNLDNMRIAFSRGDLVLSQMENKGRLVSHPQSYSLQNIWEEASGGLESYSSLWGDITISGIYTH